MFVGHKMHDCCIGNRNQICLALFILCVTYARADILVFSAASRHQIEEEFRDAPARFGGLIPSEGIKGMVAYADPPTACVPIAGPPNVSNYAGNWIVLIARFDCHFEVKIRMAQQAGFDAAIVHNVNDSDLIPMSAKDPVGITIPSVFISEIPGLIIKANYLYDHLYFLLINDDLPFNINTHLLLPFAIVVGICFLVMVVFMIVRCIKDRRRQRRHRLPNSSLKKIPTHKYTKGDPYETCAICLEDYVEGEKLRVLPCAHAYHTKCIDPWLTKKRRVCPVCKRKVFAADERVVTDSDSDTDADDSTPLLRDGHQGTQGGTFDNQHVDFATNVFARRNRRNSNASNSSSSDTSGISFPESGSSHATEPSGAPVFLISDSHSINGEQPELASSSSIAEKYHPAIVHSPPLRNTEISVNLVSSEHHSSTSPPDEVNAKGKNDVVV